MIAVLLLVLLAQPADPLDDLAAAGHWEELRVLADDRLASDPDDDLAHYWFGRDLLAQALELADGGRVGRDIGRTLLDRAVQHLEQVDEQPDTSTSDALDWLLEARFARRWALANGDARNPVEARLETELGSYWERDGVAMAAFLRGALADEAGAPDALAWYERAAGAAPERSRFQQRLALAYAGAGRRSEALQAYDQAAAAPDGWLEDLLSVLITILPGRRDSEARLARLDALLAWPEWSDHALLAWYRAHALAQLGRSEEAVHAFELATRGRTAETDRAYASHLIAAGRFDEALALLLPRVREHDWASLDQALVAIGRLASMREHEQAVAACDDLLAVEPRHELVLWNRALLLWKAGRDDEAQEAFDTLIERLPDRADVLNDAALAAWGAGRLERARMLLGQAVELPGSIDGAENLALLLLERDPGARSRVSELLDRVLAEEPGRPRALWLRHLARAKP